MRYLSREIPPEPIDDELQMLAVDLRRDIEPQAVGVVLLEVHARVLVEEILHLPLPPCGPAAPVGPLPAFEVDAAFVRVAVELA